jgi:hypothetical protein
MKKLFTLLFVAGAMSLVACGPSAEDAAKDKAAEQAKMDSIFKVASQSMTTDSAATTAPDSVATPTTEEKK